MEPRLALTTSTWSGAVDGLWSNDGNWDTPPAPGNDLVFPSGAANLASTNDLAAGTSFGALMISGSGYSIGGNSIALTGTIDASQTSGGDTLSLPIRLDGAATVSVDTAGASLTLAGVISGSAGLTKQGSGELDLSADNTYTGTTTLSGGTLKVDGSQGGSPVDIASGAVLEGSGTVGSISASNGGTVSPGGPAPAILTDSGDLTLQSGSTESAVLNGTTAGSTYSQLAVAGQVNLGGATLVVSLGFTPTGNESFFLINNTGSSPVSGTFAGLPQGATVTAGGEPFQISYTGGDGNDVVLTHLVSSATTLSTSTTSAVAGQTVTLTATAASADVGTSTTPTGTVEFFSGSTSLGTATLSGGVASLDTTALTVGDNAITAVYQGDSTFNTSTSTATNVTVTQASTTTTVNVTPSPAVFGQAVGLTATVTPVSPGAGTPTGTVEFFNGSTSLGTANLSGGVASLQTTALALGDNAITAVYSGDADFATSTSPASTATIDQASTTTTVNVTPNPSGLGATATLTATITPISPGAGSPTGTVEFFNGSTSLGTATVSGGVASLGTSALALGDNTITAVYSGDADFATSTSPGFTATVEQASTTTLVSSVSTVVFGQPVTLTATVAAATGTGTPSGTVTFMSGTTVLGSASLTSGIAALTTSSLPGGTDAITAVYQGDSTFAGSTSAATNVTVTQASTTTTVTASPNPGGLNQTVTLTATITSTVSNGVQPTGTVEFFSGGVSLGTATATAGVASLQTTALTLGANSITATYQGDTNYGSSTSPAATVTIDQASSTTLLTSSAATVVGQSVTLTATVTAGTGSGTPTGTVQFFNGSTSLGTASLSGGVATLNTSALALGANAVTAQYLGDSTFAGSTSAASNVSVSQATTTTKVSVSPGTSVLGQSVTLTAVVSPVGPGAGSPTGTVQFFSGSTSLGTATLSGGVATLQTTALTSGSNAITAVYQGDTNFVTSTAAAVTARVGQASATVGLSVSKTNPVSSEAVVLTATVSGSPSSTTPTGTVVFYANGAAIGQGTLTNGVATFTTSSLAVGTETLKAVYGGDANFGGTTSSTTSIVVGTSMERYLNQIYLDVLGRPAEQAGLDYWSGQLASGVPLRRVVRLIVNSPEGHMEAVQTVYQTFLRRPATTSEVSAALSPASLASGVGLEAQVLGSREYFDSQGGGTIDGFITALYRDVLGTSDVPTAARTQLGQELRQGVSTTTVAQDLLVSHQGRVALINALYQKILGRSADSVGTIDLLGMMSRGGRINQALVALLASEEFRSPFGVTG